jgi:Fe-S-cluster containining protein
VRQPTIHTQTAEILRDLVRAAVLDHAAFQTTLNPCELSTCKATCCHDGVSLSDEEKSNIQTMVESSPEEFADTLDGRHACELFERIPSGGWKTSTRPALPAETADDYPGHFPRTRCVFLDSHHRCTIQRYSMNHHHPDWLHKPLTCWIHPILIKTGSPGSRPTITLPSPANDPQRSPDYPGFASCTHCGRPDNDGIPAHQALAAELRLLGEIAGRDLLSELQAPTAPE